MTQERLSAGVARFATHRRTFADVRYAACITVSVTGILKTTPDRQPGTCQPTGAFLQLRTIRGVSRVVIPGRENWLDIPSAIGFFCFYKNLNSTICSS